MRHTSKSSREPATPPGAPQFENTFVLSSWYPSVWRTDADAQLAEGTEGDGHVRLVSYGLRHPERVKEPLGYVENESNHPSLTPAFLTATMLLPAWCWGGKESLFLRLDGDARRVYLIGSLLSRVTPVRFK